MSDADLELRKSPPIRLRSVSIDENGLTPKPIVESDESQIPWSQLVLLVTGRLSRKRVELQERKGRRGENEIPEASQFFADEAVVDQFTRYSRLRYFLKAQARPDSDHDEDYA